jgi:hypothetical protein
VATKTSALQAALSQSGGKRQQPASQPIDDPVAPAAIITGPARPPSRAGKENISAWLSPEYQTSLRLVHARTGRKKQDLIAEALNDLFAKYDVPQVRED